MAAEISLLATGLPGAVVISVFSTGLGADSGFVLPRTLPATALLFSEPDVSVSGTSISRRSSSYPSHLSCTRPIIPLGRAANTVTTTAQTFPVWLLRHMAPPLLKPRVNTAIIKFSNIFGYLIEIVSMYKAAAVDKARLSCLMPTLRRPFEPILDHIRCKLGISEDKYMEAGPCNISNCSKSGLEEREITMTRTIPSMTFMNMSVETIDDCFNDMNKLEYGIRVLIKIADDESCDDPRFIGICQKLLNEQKVIIEDTCSSPRYD